MTTRIRSAIPWITLVICAALIAQSVSAAEPKWDSLLASVDTAKNGVSGDWKKTTDALTVRAAQGARLALREAPEGEYDLRVSFTRRTGIHSIGLIVVQGGRQVVFEVDAWGSHLAGFQNIDGQSIRDNPTRRDNVRLENNKRYSMTVEVRKDQLRGLLDGKEIAKFQTDGGNLSLPDLWAMRDPKQLGLVAWESETTFHSIELRSVNSEPVAVANNTSTTKLPAKPMNSSTNKPATGSTGSTGKSTARPTASVPAKNPSPATEKSRTGKRVLIVIANQHFFYREYGDPRQELERAGIKVTVAAGRKSPCRPHEGSGQGPDGGTVQPDLALSDVKASDFDAVLFSGGWGASMYQFAFNGRYNDPNYNGDRAIKAEANRVINEFIAQDKYVCALCNGVSVLAWARVNGKSPLAGKRVCAPVRQAPMGIYNGRPGQPSCRWHPESNGAILSPSGVIGQPGNVADDVLVDGKIITGEDDPSAREMGRRIAEVLTRDE